MNATDELLTVKEVQDLLKIDRITIYRMLKDGRLCGLKIGHQWRFSRHEVDSLLSNGASYQAPQPAHIDNASSLAPVALPSQALPIHCVQMIQDVFAEVAGVGSVTTDQDGEPLTAFSNSCRFCDLIMGSERGRQACIASWQRLAEKKEPRPSFATCHAGLQYARARIQPNGEMAAMLVSGQFYTQPPDPAEETQRVQRLAGQYGIDPEALAEAAQGLPVLDERKYAQLGGWLESVAHTFEDISRERAELMGRLRTIAAMSTLEP